MELSCAWERRTRSVAMNAVPQEPPMFLARFVRPVDVVVFGLFHADIGNGVDGNKEKGQTRSLENAHKDKLAVTDAEVDIGHVDEAGSEHKKAKTDQFAGIDFAGQEANDGHHGHHHEAGRGEHETSQLGGIAKKSLDELRNENRCAVEGEAQDEHEHKADGGRSGG